MKRFVEINDDSDTSDARIVTIADDFAAEPFDFHAVLDDGDALIVEVTEFGIVVTISGFVVADPHKCEWTVRSCGNKSANGILT